MVPRTDLPWAIYSRSAIETARHLIEQAGSVDDAHKAVTAAAADMKRPHGRPPASDVHWLLIADAIRRHEACTDNSALKQVADLQLDKKRRDFKKKKDAIVRRLRDKLEGGTLAEFARRYDVVADKVHDPERGVTFVFLDKEGK